MVPDIPPANGEHKTGIPRRSQAVARGPVNGSRASTADRVNAEPSPISATAAAARRPATLAGYPGRLDEGRRPGGRVRHRHRPTPRRDSPQRSCAARQRAERQDLHARDAGGRTIATRPYRRFPFTSRSRSVTAAAISLGCWNRTVRQLRLAAVAARRSYSQPARGYRAAPATQAATIYVACRSRLPRARTGGLRYWNCPNTLPGHGSPAVTTPSLPRCA
jgi:hypothetical protein